MPSVTAGLGGASLVQSYISGKKSDKYMSQGAAATRAQLGIAQGQEERAGEEYEYYKEHGRPLIEGVIEDVEAYDSGEALTERLGDVSADVAQTFDKGREISARRQMRRGVDPSSGQFAGMDRAQELNRTLAEVQGRNEAREDIDDEQWAKRLTAIDVLRGGASRAASDYGSAGRGYGDVGRTQYGVAERYGAASGAAARGGMRLIASEYAPTPGVQDTVTNSPVGVVDNSQEWT